jgi:hypothetical protein
MKQVMGESTVTPGLIFSRKRERSVRFFELRASRLTEGAL